MYFVRLIFPDLFIFSSQSLTEDFSNIEPTFSILILNQLHAAFLYSGADDLAMP